ncbi:MAG: sodium:solute symporter, partial [Odoribacter sp.]|nr:sodium:solute symporter [Odoribacter sp.]
AAVFLSYFGVLILVSFFTSRKAENAVFFTANRTSPWYLVAFGMIGAQLSGVTFISIPGEVGNSAWTYLPVVLGNGVGYVVIALVLLPLFYKLNLVSIYSWLADRFGENARLTGSFFFIVSQLIGASFRLFLVVGVLQLAFFDAVGIPFWATVFITIGLVWVYTFRGGIKTIVWTDALQTVFMLLSVVVTVMVVCRALDFDFAGMIGAVRESPLSRTFDFDWRSGHNAVKQFLAGIAITVALNGLDQNMMQKNLTCKTLKACRTNMFSFSVLFLLANVLFLTLGVLLYLYAERFGIVLPRKSDDVFAFLSLNYFGVTAGLFFLLGITAAAYSSVDSSLTALTTSFSIDFLKIDPKDSAHKRKRIRVHLAFSLLMCLVIILFRELNDSSVINAVFKAVGYTYGPILALFVFGLATRYGVKGKYLPGVCLLAPVLSYVINRYSEQWLWGYRFGFEILLLNASICFAGLLLIRKKNAV